jgi:hypothetical protein
LNPICENSPNAFRPVRCDVIAHAAFRAPLASIADLRRQPGPPGRSVLPATFLKNADEQTVAGLSVILHAIAACGLQNTSFTDWGVLAAPRFLARSTMVVSLQRFMTEGAWGVSPHVIPHRSLHSLSGTISNALKMNGPNFGVGGGQAGATEVLLAALSMLERLHLPGLWVVWTALEPEGELDMAGRADPATECRALAVALAPTSPDPKAITLQLEGSHSGPGNVDSELGREYFYLETLLNRLAATGERGGQVSHDLDGGLRVVLQCCRRFQPAMFGCTIGGKPALAVSDTGLTGGAGVQR